MLLPSLHAVLLVLLTGVQFTTALRSPPPKLDLRSNPFPIERLLPDANSNVKLAHVIEDASHISPPPSPPQSPANNPRSITPRSPSPDNDQANDLVLGSETIPSNPSNVVVSLSCGQSFLSQASSAQASAQRNGGAGGGGDGGYKWANYNATMRIIEEVSNKEARLGRWGVEKVVMEGGKGGAEEGEGGKEGGEGMGRCEVVGCRRGSGVWWCWEGDGPAEVDRMFSILWGANYVLEECYPFVDRQDVKAMKKLEVAGKVVFTGGWSVMVKGGECR